MQSQLFWRCFWQCRPSRTTTPNAAPWSEVEGVVADGTTSCENYLDTSLGEDGTICTTYAAGVFEPARNVSQLI